MIPRLRPTFDSSDLLALLGGHFSGNGVLRFEAEMRKHTKKRYAIAFPHARSGLYALIKAKGWVGKEIVIPAFTCAVVPNAIIASGNQPRIIDVSEYDFNMDCAQLRAAINEHTVAVVATHIYGHPMDLAHLAEILEPWPDLDVIQDCALGLNSHDGQTPTWQNGLAALFSFSIGKQASSVEGGVFVMDDATLYENMSRCRDEAFSKPVWYRGIYQSAFFLATWLGIRPIFWRGIFWLANNTSVLNFLTEYYDNDKVVLPPTMFEKLPENLGALGAAQMRKCQDLVSIRNDNTHKLRDALSSARGVQLPTVRQGASFSHCAFLVDDRARFIAHMAANGVTAASDVFDYALADMPIYAPYALQDCPVARKISKQVVTLPNYPDLTDEQVNTMLNAIKSWGG